jgi:hypothetical protein
MTKRRSKSFKKQHQGWKETWVTNDSRSSGKGLHYTVQMTQQMQRISFPLLEPAYFGGYVRAQVSSRRCYKLVSDFDTSEMVDQTY